MNCSKFACLGTKAYGSCALVGTGLDDTLRGFAVSPLDELRPSTAQRSSVSR